MISRLEFRIVDIATNDQPVKSIRYSVEIYSRALEEPHKRWDVDYTTEDGILRIPKPFPPYGRLRLWIEVVDKEHGFRNAYGEFSYRIDTTKPHDPPRVQLQPGVILTGTVVDARTGSTLAGVEVAPLLWSVHVHYSDWSQAVKTNMKGEFRIACERSRGLGARHPEYHRFEVEFPAGESPHGGEEKLCELQMIPLPPMRLLRCRFVDDQSGEPIEGAYAEIGGAQSDENGHLEIKVAQPTWEERSKHRFEFSSSNHRDREIPMERFSLAQETVIALQLQELVRGQVFGEDERPLSDCIVELDKETSHVDGSFFRVSGPNRRGEWEDYIGDIYSEFMLRVTVDGNVRSLRKYTRGEITRGTVITRLADGHRVSSRLIANVPLDEHNTPLVMLTKLADEDFQWLAPVETDGSFSFYGLPDGEYVLQLCPKKFMSRGAPVRWSEWHWLRFAKFLRKMPADVYPNKPWETRLAVAGDDVELEPIDLHAAGVLPGRVVGIAFQSDASGRPHANELGRLWHNQETGSHVPVFLEEFMTDADGRFEIKHCPPGKYLLRMGGDATWIHVPPEKTVELRLFERNED